MCGLTGIALTHPLDVAELRARLRTMIATIRYRGPDAECVWSDAQVGLAHARLSVLDLSPAGQQPMSDAEGRVWLAFNGEIYNFKTLRSELEQQGHHFRSETDSEVILQGYKAWGDEVILRLRGMFAIALWDTRIFSLLLARDRIGKKPLYYAETPSGLVFGSEIKAITAWPDVVRSADLNAIHHYLSLQYVPTPQTAFVGIRCLPPAHVLTLKVRNDGRPSAPTLRRYWSLPKPAEAASRRSDPDLVDELIGKLKESVRLRMVADVPLGVFLSGGVDSSSVVAMMAAQGAGQIKTFSVGFDRPEYDETAYARLVARRFGTDHHELIVGADTVGILSQLAWHFDEPLADASAVPSFCLSQFARRHVTVALSGDGGDECFLGYDRYIAMRRLEHLDRIPRWIRTAAAALAGRVPGSPRFSRRKATLVKHLLAAAGSPDHYERFIMYFTDSMKQEGYGPALRPLLAQYSLDLLRPYFNQGTDLSSGANWADIHTYLPDDLMVKVDRTTMAHGLECRSPFLDHELMEWAAGLDVPTRMAGGATKALLKKAMAPLLPRSILLRRKMGFGCPVNHWLRGELREMVHDLLLSPSFERRGLFERTYIERMLREHTLGVDHHHPRIWALLMLELWFRMWIDPAAAPVRPVAM